MSTKSLGLAVSKYVGSSEQAGSIAGSSKTHFSSGESSKIWSSTELNSETGFKIPKSSGTLLKLVPSSNLIQFCDGNSGLPAVEWRLVVAWVRVVGWNLSLLYRERRIIQNAVPTIRPTGIAKAAISHRRLSLGFSPVLPLAFCWCRAVGSGPSVSVKYLISMGIRRRRRCKEEFLYWPLKNFSLVYVGPSEPLKGVDVVVVSGIFDMVVRVFVISNLLDRLDMASMFWFSADLNVAQ